MKRKTRNVIVCTLNTISIECVLYFSFLSFFFFFNSISYFAQFLLHFRWSAWFFCAACAYVYAYLCCACNLIGSDEEQLHDSCYVSNSVSDIRSSVFFFSVSSLLFNLCTSHWFFFLVFSAFLIIFALHFFPFINSWLSLSTNFNEIQKKIWEIKKKKISHIKTLMLFQTKFTSYSPKTKDLFTIWIMNSNFIKFYYCTIVSK